MPFKNDSEEVCLLLLILWFRKIEKIVHALEDDWPLIYWGVIISTCTSFMISFNYKYIRRFPDTSFLQEEKKK